MQSIRAIAIALSLFLLANPIRADETPAKSKIVAVDLFKNGLAVVKREVTLGKPGVYVLDDVPHPVHGTYWIESAGPVDTLVQMRDVEVPANETTPGNLQEDLAGKKVTLYFKGDKRAPVVGTMMKFTPAKPGEVIAQSKYLVVQTAKGRTYVDSSEVASVEAEDAGEKVKRRQPRLVLTLADTEKAETRVAIRYMTHGLSWAASYKIDITDPKTLALEQHAVIKNELAELEGAEVRLISGYPSVQFAHVQSLLSPGSTLAGFFQQLSGGSWRIPDFASNSVMTQQVMMNSSSQGGAYNVSLGAIPTGEGVDLHYQPIGKRTLKEGDTLALTVAKGKSEYERIVEWLIPDTRNDYGVNDGRGRGNDEEDAPWDALKFKNPLSFPMTTGSALVTANGAFNGQRTTYWVNAGEETVLRVGKALSVRTRSLENELQAKDGSGRDFIWAGGRQFRKSIVEGELAASNHRKESVQMVIRRRFSGELVRADGSPKSSLREEGVFSINKRNELVWTLALKAGEEQKLKYTYSVLVPY
ncbi:MAG TPA: hypothetical protein VG122_00625 [Gemmata sp.]|nr:hypothetical protein [Gemmata sp.]